MTGNTNRKREGEELMKKQVEMSKAIGVKVRWNGQPMMKYGWMIRLSLILAVAFLFFCGTVRAQDVPKKEKKVAGEQKVDHRVIYILDDEGIMPRTVIAKQGTTMIWINYSHDPAEIIFSKQTKIACGKPVNFVIGDSGGYQSKKLEQGMTGSLCFLDKGDYEYQLKQNPSAGPGTTNIVKGTVKIY